MSTKEYFTTGEVSQLVNISRATVSRKFDAGILRGKKNPVTGERLVSRESLLSFMRQYDLPLKDLDKSALKRILLNSPDERLHFVLTRAFAEDDRVVIETIRSGYDALIKCSKNPPDLFIIDEDLTEFSSAEAVRSIKRLDEQNQIKILSCLHTFNADKFREIDADDFVAKDSLEAEELARKITGLLDLTQDTHATDANYDHQRRWNRIPVSLNAHIEAFPVENPLKRESGTARLENISLGGAFLSRIQMDNGYLPGHNFHFIVKVDESPLDDFQSECRVIRMKTNGSLSAGLQFVEISEGDRNKISSLAM